MPSQQTDKLDVFEMFYASVGPSLWDDLRQPVEEDAPVEAASDVFEEDHLQKMID
jgi:hypothetical protein